MSSQMNSLVGPPPPAPQPPVAADAVTSDDEGSIKSRNPNRWFFDKSRIENTPSRRAGMDSDKELTYRQQSANFIQDIGQRLQVNQLCINTAIVYMHRFYMYHSFTHFHRNAISTASIFLAAKVEEQPRKLEHVIKVAHYCLHRDQPNIDPKSEAYQKQSAELVMNENILLQTLGFDVAIDHPHTHVVKCCQLVRGMFSSHAASKDLGQTSYFMATNSLHLTTMCLQYRPTLVACVCIHLACKWSSWEIPRSKEGKDWWKYVDEAVTAEQLEELTTEFLAIFNKSPSRLKRKIISLNAATGGAPIPMNMLGTSITAVDSASGQSSSSAIRSRSRSPSPKRQRVSKPGETHGVMTHGKPHPQSQGLQVVPLHGMKQPSSHGGHHGVSVPPPGSKHGHVGLKPSSSHPPKPYPPPSSASARDQSKMSHYQQQQMQQQQHSNSVSFGSRNPIGHSHGSSSSSGGRPSVPNAQLHHSHSSSHGQHPQQGQKPPPLMGPAIINASIGNHPGYLPPLPVAIPPKVAPSKNSLSVSQAIINNASSHSMSQQQNTSSHQSSNSSHNMGHSNVPGSINSINPFLAGPVSGSGGGGSSSTTTSSSSANAHHLPGYPTNNMGSSSSANKQPSNKQMPNSMSINQITNAQIQMSQGGNSINISHPSSSDSSSHSQSGGQSLNQSSSTFMMQNRKPPSSSGSLPSTQQSTMGAQHMRNHNSQAHQVQQQVSSSRSRNKPPIDMKPTTIGNTSNNSFVISSSRTLEPVKKDPLPELGSLDFGSDNFFEDLFTPEDKNDVVKAEISTRNKGDKNQFGDNNKNRFGDSNEIGGFELGGISITGFGHSDTTVSINTSSTTAPSIIEEKESPTKHKKKKKEKHKDKNKEKHREEKKHKKDKHKDKDKSKRKKDKLEVLHSPPSPVLTPPSSGEFKFKVNLKGEKGLVHHSSSKKSSNLRQ